MRLVIVEDETAATTNLRSILADVCPDGQVIATLESVTDAVLWFSNNPPPDVVFMDIHLADGEAFHIFENIDVASPIIFTTAYDRYALDAFRVNSIDYLLKPIRPEDVSRALAKLSRLTHADRASYSNRISEMVATRNTNTFLIHMRDKIIPVRAENIAFCYTADERVTIHTLDGQEFPFEKSLETIYAQLPSDTYFRANRQFIISRHAIADISVWFGNRLRVNLKTPTPEHIIISKARVPEFKRWVAG